MIGHANGDGFSAGSADRLNDDGTFVAKGLSPGTYLVYAGPGAEPTRVPGGQEAGISVVTIRGADVTAVLVRTEPSHSIRGRVRFEAADLFAAHPKIVVTAWMVAGGIGGPLGPQDSQVETDGSFAIDNVVGQVVLRSGYMLPDDGSRWWSGPVLLDGQDISDVPTDFSKTHGELELVFTQRPTGVFGIVVEEATQLPAENASVVIFAADPSQRQPWASSAQLIHTDSDGRFWETMSPGRYFAIAFPDGTFKRKADAFGDLSAFEKLATPFTIDPERRVARIRLTLSRPPVLKR